MRGTKFHRNTYTWGGQTPDLKDKDEKLVGFRLSAAKYEALKALAFKRRKPVQLLILEALETKYKLGDKVKAAPAQEKRLD